MFAGVAATTARAIVVPGARKEDHILEVASFVFSVMVDANDPFSPPAIRACRCSRTGASTTGLTSGVLAAVAACKEVLTPLPMQSFFAEALSSSYRDRFVKGIVSLVAGGRAGVVDDKGLGIHIRRIFILTPCIPDFFVDARLKVGCRNTNDAMPYECVGELQLGKFAQFALVFHGVYTIEMPLKKGSHVLTPLGHGWLESWELFGERSSRIDAFDFEMLQGNFIFVWFFLTRHGELEDVVKRRKWRAS
ncbi:hypothetical protein HG530_008625 [Fusarium avenaceum]|nr:hypothetical protein HG530_008625 [Fusarium avenaceum]